LHNHSGACASPKSNSGFAGYLIVDIGDSTIASPFGNLRVNKGANKSNENAKKRTAAPFRAGWYGRRARRSGDWIG
jgi:hypothetical protein